MAGAGPSALTMKRCKEGESASRPKCSNSMACAPFELGACKYGSPGTRVDLEDRSFGTYEVLQVACMQPYRPSAL